MISNLPVCRQSLQRKISDSLEKVRVEFMGQKNGRVRDLQKLVGTATPEQKPAVGKRFNEVRTSVSAALEARAEELKVTICEDGVRF